MAHGGLTPSNLTPAPLCRGGRGGESEERKSWEEKELAVQLPLPSSEQSVGVGPPVSGTTALMPAALCCGPLFPLVRNEKTGSE